MPTTPNSSVLATARLWENLAEPVEALRIHIANELRNAGHRTNNPDAPNPKPEVDQYGNFLTPVHLTRTEAAAAHAQWLANRWEDVSEAVRAAALAAYNVQTLLHGNKNTQGLLGVRIEQTDKPRCWAADLDGYHIARTDGGWSDPTCHEIPRAGNTGPCDKCYARHLRYRKRNNLPSLSSENRAPAA